MHSIINKTVAILAILMMIGLNFLPVSVYAANEIKQNSETKEENVKFNATINGQYESKLNINEENSLELSLEVINSGYLKDVQVTLDNTNYLIENVSNENVANIENNVISLKEVNSNESKKINIPIKFNKSNLISEDEFNKQSEVKLNAVYVNDKGKEKKIKKKKKKKRKRKKKEK